MRPQSRQTRLPSDVLLQVSSPMGIKHVDDASLVSLESLQDHCSVLLPITISRRAVVLHLRQDQKVDDADHAGKHGTEKE